MARSGPDGFIAARLPKSVLNGPGAQWNALLDLGKRIRSASERFPSDMRIMVAHRRAFMANESHDHRIGNATEPTVQQPSHATGAGIITQQPRGPLPCHYATQPRAKIFTDAQVRVRQFVCHAAADGQSCQ